MKCIFISLEQKHDRGQVIVISLSCSFDCALPGCKSTFIFRLAKEIPGFFKLHLLRGVEVTRLGGEIDYTLVVSLSGGEVTEYLLL